MPLRILFFGTAELACTTLEALAENSEFQVSGVVTQPDKPRGRDMQVHPSAVKATALRLNLSVLQPERARDPLFIEEIRALKPDLGVVVAYGQILPQALLDVPKFGCLNVHTSLLPKHRGAAPIQWAILSGDAETGVTIMQMDAGLDTGPILTRRTTPISADETAQTLHDRLAIMGAELLVETIPPYVRGEITPRPQPEGSTYARKIEKVDGRIHWPESAVFIERKIRAFTPWPGAFTTVEIGGKPRILKIWRAQVEPLAGAPGAIMQSERAELVIACGQDALRILDLQLEGRKRMPVHEFLAGHSISKLIAS
jgi:methionyl-tRNA formyltransferase